MLVLGKKIYRNMQEQVAFNAEQIEKIQEYLDGISIDDKLVVVDSLSGTLSPEEIEIVKKPLAFISDGTTVYVKTTKDPSNRLIFRAIDIVSETVSATYIRLLLVGIYVDISTGDFGSAPTNLIETYNKTQADSILALKADKTELNAKANLSGADFTGGITAPSIVQTMTGYSFEKQTTTKGTLEYIYAGMVINGNKLTLVVSYNFTRATGATGSLASGRFMIPVDVMAKIFPSFSAFVDVRKISGAKSSYQTVDAIGQFIKYDGSSLYSSIADITALTEGETYYFRQELTILLSDNLAQ